MSAVVRVGERDDMLTALSKEIIGIKKYCERERPDLVVVLGDRDEPFAAAIVAGHLGIPVAHLHGGETTGPVVDEYIRHAITKFSHLHFTATRRSFQNVLQLGEERRRVHPVGAIGFDELRNRRYTSRRSLAERFGLNPALPWLVVLQHPAALEAVPLQVQIQTTLRSIEQIPAEKILLYPNSDTGSAVFIRALKHAASRLTFHLFRHFNRSDYLSFLKQSQALVGNSSSGIIESIFFRLPVVNIGSRQRGRERSYNVIDAPYESAAIARAIRRALSPVFRKRCRRLPNPYGTGAVSKKIVRHIERALADKNLLAKKCV